MPLFLIQFSISLLTVHHWMLCCLGNSIRASSQQRGTRECFELHAWSVLCNLLCALGLVVGGESCADSGKPSDALVYLLGYRIWGERVSIFQRCHHQHHHVDAGGISLRPLACKCLINVLLNCATLSAGHLGPKASTFTCKATTGKMQETTFARLRTIHQLC